MFWALALCQSDWRNCGLCVGLHAENGAMLSVGIWWRENKNKLVEWKVLVWLTEDCLDQVMRIPRLTVPLSQDSKPNPQSSKLVRNYWEKSRIDMFKELFEDLHCSSKDMIPFLLAKQHLMTKHLTCGFVTQKLLACMQQDSSSQQATF